MPSSGADVLRGNKACRVSILKSASSVNGHLYRHAGSSKCTWSIFQRNAPLFICLAASLITWLTSELSLMQKNRALAFKEAPPFYPEMFKPHCFYQRQISKRSDTKKKAFIKRKIFNKLEGDHRDERKLRRRKQMSTRRHTFSIQPTVMPLVPLSCKRKLKWHSWGVGERKILLLPLPDFLFLLSLHGKD